MDLRELAARVNRLADEMGWSGPSSLWQRTPRNMATSVIIEAAELLEHFQWSDEPADRDEVAAEMADVLIYLLQLAHVMGIDLEQAVLTKIEDNYHTKARL